MLKKKKYILLIFQNIPQIVIEIMILNGDKWHYLAVKKISALLRGITSKPYGDF